MMNLNAHVREAMLHDPVCCPNLTECYQRYRCQLREQNDPCGITYIIDEILNNLDYEHRRYNIHLNERVEASHSSLDDLSKPYPQYVMETLDLILNFLKIEDSYEVSEASSEDCQKRKTVNFYKKTGKLAAKQTAECLLHIPAVRSGEMAIFCNI